MFWIILRSLLLALVQVWVTIDRGPHCRNRSPGGRTRPDPTPPIILIFNSPSISVLSRKLDMLQLHTRTWSRSNSVQGAGSCLTPPRIIIIIIIMFLCNTVWTSHAFCLCVLKCLQENWEAGLRHEGWVVCCINESTTESSLFKGKVSTPSEFTCKNTLIVYFRYKYIKVLWLGIWLQAEKPPECVWLYLWEVLVVENLLSCPGHLTS